MAAAPVTPTPEDVSGLTALFEWIRQWGWGLVVAVGGPASWRAASGYTKIKSRQDEHEKEIEALKVGRAAADIRIAELPTRADLSRESEATRQEVRAGLANVMQLIGSHRNN